MFPGLVQDLGSITSIEAGADGSRLVLRTALTAEIAEGDSVAVNGVCLTATAIQNGTFAADAMNETLRRTSLGGLGEGSSVNLELALRADQRLGGHIMQGHVDAVGQIGGVRQDGFASIVTVEAGDEVLRYIVEKGSIAVDGVSLTVARVDDRCFDVSLIPETLGRTNFGTAQPGRTVNLEVDIVAKYIEKLVEHAR